MKIFAILGAERALIHPAIYQCGHRDGQRYGIGRKLGKANPVLGERKERAPAAGTDPLIMLERRILYLIPVPQLLLSGDQILNVHHRGKFVPAPPAFGTGTLPGHVLVKANAQLSRPLKDVEKLPKRQPKQRHDDRYRVHQGKEIVPVPFEPGVTHGQQQAGDADGEQKHERKDVFPEKLNGHCPFVPH